jgi:hypothetical protein
MGKKNKKQQKMEKIQKRHRDNQEELFMRELDNIVMDVIEQVNNSVDMLENNSHTSNNIDADGSLTGMLGTLDNVSNNSVDILDVYDSLLLTNVQIGNILSNFQGQLAKSKDVDAINDTIMDFTEDFLAFQVWLKQQLQMYDQVNFTHAEELAVGKEYLKMCKGSNDVKACLHELVKGQTTLADVSI